MLSSNFVRERPYRCRRGSALATLQQAWDVGASGGNFILGPVVGVYGVASAFLIVGIGALTGAAGYVIGSRKKL